MSGDNTITIVRDIDTCRALWERFSPKKSLFDLWEYRFPIWDIYRYELAFVVLGSTEDPRGVLPLWRHPEENRYLWFGDLGDDFNWQEDASFWVRDPNDIPALLAAAPRPLHLTCITQEAAQMVQGDPHLQEAKPKSVLPLSGIDTTETYLALLPKKLRQNLRRDHRAMADAGVELRTDVREDYKALARMNAEKFADSPFHDERFVRVLGQIVDAGYADGAPFRTHMISAYLHGEPVATDCMFFTGATACVPLCGADTRKLPGVGNAMHLVDIEQAIAAGMTTLDLCEVEPDAKKLDLFPTVPLWSYMAY